MAPFLETHANEEVAFCPKDLEERGRMGRQDLRLVTCVVAQHAALVTCHGFMLNLNLRNSGCVMQHAQIYRLIQTALFQVKGTYSRTHRNIDLLFGVSFYSLFLLPKP